MPERWLVLFTPLGPGTGDYRLGEALRRLGARSINRTPEGASALFPEPEDPVSFMAEVEGILWFELGLVPSALHWEWLAGEDWTRRWKESVRPIRLGTGLTLRLVPAPVFGDGRHPTTLRCLRFLEELVRPGDRLADVGTGSGVLAVAGALLGAERVEAFDSDALTCSVAHRNAQLNGVSHRVEVQHLQVGGEAESGFASGGLDGVIANLAPAELSPVIPILTRCMARGAWALVSGIPSSEQARVQGWFAETAEPLPSGPPRSQGKAEVVMEAEDDGWWTAVLATSAVAESLSRRG